MYDTTCLHFKKDSPNLILIVSLSNKKDKSSKSPLMTYCYPPTIMHPNFFIDTFIDKFSLTVP